MEAEVTQQRGYWREGGERISAREAWDIWARHAYGILIDVAQTYHSTITYGELRDRLFAASGIRTSALLQNWIGEVLNRVIHESRRRGDPPLSALVVRTEDGMVGGGTTRCFGSLASHQRKTRWRGRSMLPAPDWPATTTSGHRYRQMEGASAGTEAAGSRQSPSRSDPAAPPAGLPHLLRPASRERHV